MKNKILLFIIFGLLSFLVVRVVPKPPAAHLDYALQAATENVSLFEQPQAGETPIVDVIDHAQHEILVEVYLLSDQKIITALEQAHDRGVTVKVMLEQRPFGGGDLNARSSDALTADHVAVAWTNPLFPLTHEKAMVIDDSTALVLNQNLTTSAFEKNREYDVIDTNPEDVTMVKNIFTADWQRQSFTQSNSHLLVSPDTARPALTGIIQSASKSIDIEMEVVSDPAIESLLSDKAKTIPVRIILPDLKKLAANESAIKTLQQAGVKVKTISSPYLHAKLVLVDEQSAYVGSINFSTQSMDKNRELGIYLAEPKSIQTLTTSFTDDWNHAAEASL